MSLTKEQLENAVYVDMTADTVRFLLDEVSDETLDDLCNSLEMAVNDVDGGSDRAFVIIEIAKSFPKEDADDAQHEHLKEVSDGAE